MVFCLTFYIISLYMASQKGNKIQILSANCRGIQSKKKRYDVINYMKSKNPDILCLQDTHLITEEEFNLKTMWDGEVILHGMRTISRGVAILLNNTFEHTIKKVVKNPTGNMIALDLTLSDITVKLINIFFFTSEMVLRILFKIVFRKLETMLKRVTICCNQKTSTLLNTNIHIRIDFKPHISYHHINNIIYPFT